MGAVHVGTCSWTEKTMVGLWYPKGVTSPEQRLRYYAGRFDTVEVDSSFYALPLRRNSELWVERTPDDFSFHVKAYGMMTGHEVEARSLPSVLREFPHEVTARGRVKDPHPDMVDAAFDLFVNALEPLRDSGKLGGVLMQFPPYFTAKTADEERRNLEYLDYAREKLDGHRVLVEFRHPSWVGPDAADRTLRWLADRGLTYVSVDSPQFETGSTMPPLAALTSNWAYVRLHGRNAQAWFGKHESSADRFDYLYGEDELREWEPKIRDLARDADETFVLFNNNKRDYAQRNAAEIATILGDLVPPRTGGPTGTEPTLF
jgi:uncharacterized protein YecE (DUF72 family)